LIIIDESLLRLTAVVFGRRQLRMPVLGFEYPFRCMALCINSPSLEIQIR